jgi:diacylglycerol kinase
MNYRRIIQSFKDAVRGIEIVYKNEQNFRLQVFLALVVVFLMLFFPLSKGERIVICFLIFLVLILELLNSAVERLVDLLKPRLSLQVEGVKDIMAAVVLIASLSSFIIGLIVFFPYLVDFFTGRW